VLTEPERDFLTPTQARGLLRRAWIRAPFDGKIIPHKTTKP
jgi:multidrug resistance efflux pump